MGPSPAHLGMRALLKRMEKEWPFTVQEEVKVAGHRIDFVLVNPAGEHLLGVDVNGDRWHRWAKIRACDVKKLARVFDPSEAHVLVLGVWWSRLQSSPVSVERAVAQGLVGNRLAWWDWAVPWEEMDRVVEGSGRLAASLVVAENGPDLLPM